MAYYRSAGSVPPKRHTQHRAPDGSLYREELMGEEGFSSDSSLLYHHGVPSAIVDARPWELPDLSTTPNEPLLPRHLKLHDLFDDGAGRDVVTGRRLVLANADVRLSYVVAADTSPLYRNATGDECVFIEAGTGTLETVFGHLAFGPGDFLVIPRATTHRWVVDVSTGSVSAGSTGGGVSTGGVSTGSTGGVSTGSTGFVRAYVVEANSHVGPPKRYLSTFGQLLELAPYCERDLRGPGEPEVRDERDVEVLVKHRGSGPLGLAGSVHVVPRHPFDVVGWDGCLYPYAFNVADFEPITGRVHQPPPVHQVFEGTNFVICTFVPRKVDYHPLAIPVPYYHSNVDSDEVMFYVDGDYEARKGSGIGKGSVSLHPGGHAHGPQPSAIEASLGAESFDELAVMVDTFRPLELGEGGRACDDGAYAWSWSR